MSLPEFVFDRLCADMRQQMDGMTALTDRLAQRRLAPEDQACVDGIAEAAQSVRALLAGALDLHRLDRSSLSLAAEPVPLRSLADEIQSRWESRGVAAGVTLLVSYDGPPEAAALTDRTRLMQLFDGFIGEAVGARSHGAVEATLRAERDAGSLLLEGRIRGARIDAWSGLDAETRARNLDHKLGLEVALGALLAHAIVEAMGGELRRETSAGASEVCSFRLRLAEAQEPVQAAPKASARPVHVLVVDDNATNRIVAQSLVEMFDCTCEGAEDGVEAVEAVKSGRFDLVLMDIRMPRMDGVEATRAIRALAGPLAAIPIIALTANADPEDAAGYLAAGMNAVVEKPMKPEQLLIALQQALSEPAADAA